MRLLWLHLTGRRCRAFWRDIRGRERCRLERGHAVRMHKGRKSDHPVGILYQGTKS